MNIENLQRKAAVGGNECSMLRLVYLYLEEAANLWRLVSKDNACLERSETCA